MAIDLTGGIDPAREYVFAERPEDPEMRDSVSFWTVDDRGALGLPRIGVEAVSANWGNHENQINVAFADGRVFRLRGEAPSLPAQDASGRPAILGGGGLAFQCVEPFRTWTMTYAGPAVQTSSADLVAGRSEGPLADVAFHVEATMAVPPWVQGALQREAGERLNSSVEGKLMGGPRYEQLFRAAGHVTVDGETHEFTGSGLRIRRQGVRKLAEFWGHAWQSAVFPSGKAVGYIAYPPRPDGKPTFNEGFVFSGDGALIPARAVTAPWLTHLRAVGEDVSLVLETADGQRHAIGGETVYSTHDIHHDDDTFSVREMKKENQNFPALQQAGVRYVWEGEEAYGMLERSNLLDKISQG
ncbi:hypothetical protein [Mycolicibacter sinensis]